MNALWAGMMLVAVAYGAFHGTIPEVTQAALDSSKEAVTLCGAMLGILSFWMGLMQIGTASGLVGRLTKGLRPVLRWLFPEIPEDHPALEHIALNCVANILGLGWASTGEGLKAMEQLKKLESERRSVPPGTASGEMCTFLVLNISSLQLIPVNVIAYRSQYGSVNPAAVVGPAIVATAVSTAAGVIFCRMMRLGQS
ncbi:MAG: nucleoside recognition protein [Lachnospiraceae bacterium]|nr:nucleoside recognition protein [Lachnospiraceae bacterium]